MTKRAKSNWIEAASVTGGSAAGAGVATGAVVAAGTGTGATVMTTGLATIGGLVGGGMLAGIGVTAVGSGLVFYGGYRGIRKLLGK